MTAQDILDYAHSVVALMEDGKVTELSEAYVAAHPVGDEKDQTAIMKSIDGLLTEAAKGVEGTVEMEVPTETSDAEEAVEG